MTTERSMRRVCLVTEELFPLTPGGIGRLTFNRIERALGRDDGVELHLLVPEGRGISPDAVDALFQGRVRCHCVALDVGRALTAEEKARRYPPAQAFTDSRRHGEAFLIFRALQDLEEAGIAFDLVEFPDLCGWAFCALQEKRLGRGFQDTTFAIWLHMTLGIIKHVENTLRDRQDFGVFELERKALRDADVVVAPLGVVADFYADFYGLDADWRARVRIEFPPVTLGREGVMPGTARARAPAVERAIVFPTKLQRFKAPDLFIRGVAEFMRREPAYRGDALFAAHAFEPGYLADLKRLIPPDLKERFDFLGSLQPKAREKIFGQGIVVISSRVESLNLTAYEASAAGATLVLNERCLAFGDGTPFEDGVNCLKFDGTPDGLAEALARAILLDEPLGAVEWRADEPYWNALLAERTTRRRARRAPSKALPRVSVLLTNHDLGEYLPAAIESVLKSGYPDLEFVIVDDASTRDVDREILDRLERHGAEASPRIRVLRNASNRGLPASRNRALAHATGRYVLPLDADDLISAEFIELAVRALEKNREFDVVVPAAGYFRTGEAPELGNFCDYALFLGDAPSLGMIANRFACATSLMRRALFETFSYDERLKSFEDWALYLRLAIAGHRFLVTNDVHFFYRRRAGSMIGAIGAAEHEALINQMWQSLPTLPRPLFLPSDTRIAGHGLKQIAREWLTRKVRHGAPDKARALIKRSLHGVSEVLLIADRLKSAEGVKAGLRQVRQRLSR